MLSKCQHFICIYIFNNLIKSHYIILIQRLFSNTTHFSTSFIPNCWRLFILIFSWICVKMWKKKDTKVTDIRMTKKKKKKLTQKQRHALFFSVESGLCPGSPFKNSLIQFIIIKLFITILNNLSGTDLPQNTHSPVWTPLQQSLLR